MNVVAPSTQRARSRSNRLDVDARRNDVTTNPDVDVLGSGVSIRLPTSVIAESIIESSGGREGGVFAA
jgi:hypothetical protein